MGLDRVVRQLLSTVIKVSQLILLMVVASGCEHLHRTEAPPASPVKPVPAPAPVSDASKRERQIDQLLLEASVAFMDKRLTTPLTDNAYYRYLRVLTLDPGNQGAEEGIANIVEKYLEWAIANAERQQFHAAIRYLNKAKSVDEDHPNIEAIERSIARHRSASQSTYRLSATAVDQKAAKVIGELHEIGREIAHRDARVIIVGRSDAEGRWIYQQLNEASPYRVRAEFESGPNPLVRLIY